MKKRFLAIAIASTLVSPLVANAGDATVYGRVHVSLDQLDIGNTSGELDLKDRKTALGVKGKEDLGGGMKAFYKIEFSVDPTDNGAIKNRDRYVGIKGGMGTVKIGMFSTNNKQMAGKVDPFWHTAGEGRGAIGITSALTNSTGDDRGRQSNQIQYSSPKMGGMQMVVNAQLNGSGEPTMGLGLRYKTKTFLVFADMLKMENDADNDGLSDDLGYKTDTATKIGGTYKMGATTLGLVLEQTEDVVGADYMMLSVKHKLNDSDTVAFTYGTADGLAVSTDSTGMTLGYIHGLSKRTAVYAAVVDRSYDDSATAAANDVSGFSLGIKHSF